MRGLVTRVDNPVEDGEKPQRLALDDAATHTAIRRGDAGAVSRKRLALGHRLPGGMTS